jgi:N-acetylglucosaminyl-diphospho-decaprenol L-rhamnosyltransferase
MPLVSAIVLNYKTPADTIKCVEALLKQTIAGDIEIIVVDNHSQDDSVGKLSALLAPGKPVQVIQAPHNLGYGKGNNFGAMRAKGEFIMIINPDNSLEPDGLEKMVKHLNENPDAGILGPKLIFPNGTIRDSYRTFPTPLDLIIKRTFLRWFFKKRMCRYLQWDKDPNEVRDVDWIVGACLFMKRDLYEELGGFDKRFFLFFEDTDICRRCWKLGKRVVYFPLVVAHDSELRLSSGGVFSIFTRRNMRIHVSSAIKYFFKWGILRSKNL